MTVTFPAPRPVPEAPPRAGSEAVPEVGPATGAARHSRRAIRAALALWLAAAPALAQEAMAPATQPSALAPSSSALTCTPLTRELQTRRPLPVECRADAETVRMTLRYRAHRSEPWTTLDMVPRGDAFRAQVPCEASMLAGHIELFVVATDRAGDPVDTFGSKRRPESFRVDARSEQAPAYPGEAAPERCAEIVHCPPEFPGCEGAPSEGEGYAQSDSSSAPGPRHWVGIHFAADIGFIGGSNVCATSNHDFDCYAPGGSPYPTPLPAEVATEPGELGDVYPGTGIGTGAALGTTRVLVSYDRPLSERLSFGGRLGYAFGGGPATPEGKAFLPVHAEGRLSYWLRPLGASGVRPYLHLGGGMAQVDVKKSDVTVRDCSEATARRAFLDCIEARNDYDSANEPELPRKTLEAYRRLGNAFVTSGGGAVIGLGGAAGLQIHMNAMLLLPAAGVVLEPSLGMVYGF